MRTKFVNKLKNQMTMEEIKNKIQLKIIIVNKKNLIKRRRNELKEKEVEWQV
jgi:hypothetical protein